jgi:hypothetical protein
MENRNGVVTRRDFIRGTVGATIGATLMGSGWLRGVGEAGGRSTVFIVRDQKVMDAEMKVDKTVLKNMLEQALPPAFREGISGKLRAVRLTWNPSPH